MKCHLSSSVNNAIMLSCLRIFLPIIFLINSIFTQQISIINGGGYAARICSHLSTETITVTTMMKNPLFSCRKLNETRNDCKRKSVYSCEIPCNWTETKIKIGTKITNIIFKPKPKFELSARNRKYNPKDNLTIISDASLSLLTADQINIDFSANVSCSRKYIQNKFIICSINVLPMTKKSTASVNVNVSVSYGNSCNARIALGQIIFTYQTSFFYRFGYWIFCAVVFILIWLIVLVIYMKSISYKKRLFNEKLKQTHLTELSTDFSNIQYKAFYEYQIAIQSFSNIGKFTPRHFYSFNDFLSKLLNVELIFNETNFNCQDFENLLLKKHTLIQWIEKVELNCKVKDKCVLASYLTLYLMNYPKYFLEVLKSLMKSLIKEKHRNHKEGSQIKKSNMITEKMIGYWSTMCMYENLKKTDIGEKFFNLYRGIKSKTESGLVDCFSSKAKYALSFDNLLLGDIDYQTLIIDVSVKIKIPLMNRQELLIEIENIHVTILSLDCISQIKEKIIDKAIMEHSKLEIIEKNEEDLISCIAPISQSAFKLIFIKSNIKIQLDDFDETSIKSFIDKKCIIVNTAKHYNIKSGTKLLLTQDSMLTIGFSPVIKKNFLPNNDVAIHLQIPNEINSDSKNEPNNSSGNKTKLLFNPIRENTNKDAYLFMLMATKKSLLPLIDGFIQSITLWKPPPENYNLSLTPLSKSASFDELISTDLSTSCKTEEESQIKLTNMRSIFYIFSLYDEIAKSLLIFDTDLINLWKSNCYIHQVWSNFIINPDLIFPVNVEMAVRGGLETISNILKESSHVDSIYSGIEMDLPLIKQMFMDDIKNKYSLWWQAFVSLQEKVTDEEMIDTLSEIMQKNQLYRFKPISLKVLQMLSKTLLIEMRPKKSDDTMYCLD